MTDARSTLEKLVLERLRENHGAAAIAQRTLTPGGALSWDVPADFVAAIGEVQWLADVAVGMAKEYARAARGAGKSWRDLVEPLRIDTSDEWSEPAADAFKLVAHTPSMPHDRVWTSWRCASCGEDITDYGPYDGHPADNEHGHRADCRRHNAEIAAYRRRNGDD